MNITNEKFKHYRHLARVIANSYEEAEELLQDTMVRLCELNLPPEKNNDNYIFITMKRLYINKKNKEKVRSKIRSHSLEFNDDLYDSQTEESNLGTLQQEDDIKQDKLDLIGKVYDSLPTHDKQLFYLHFIEGISQRRISRETGLGVMPIFYRVQKIKSKIREQYNNQNTDEETN
jgi:RNA polymerase sigma factor (sigma-70 family)